MRVLIQSMMTFSVGMLMLSSCDREPEEVPVFDQTPYVFQKPTHFPPAQDVVNDLSIEKVKLGKMLFYEKQLSINNVQACASCHVQSTGFSDQAQFSRGAEGQIGKRHSMPLFNLAWHANGFFWDGRAATLQEQVLTPIQDPLEMHETLPNVVGKLSSSTQYKNQFYRAFGSYDITADKIGIALDQFLLTITSDQSKYDLYVQGKATLTDSEERGRKLFFTEYNPFFPDKSGADCAHCHTPPLFENGQYANNGLDTDATLSDFGHFLVSRNPADKGAFKVSSLRNIGFTSPYMHDGRFKTLEEVIDHYDSGVKESSGISPLIRQTIQKGLRLTPQNKADLIAFLLTLNDESLLTNPEYRK
jgi:cytochrome c peroxidase